MKDNTENLREAANSDTTAAEFLEKFQPGGPWPLTAIEPGKGPVTELTRSAQEVTSFVEKWNGRANIYFTPATPRDVSRPPPSGKFRKEDIAGSWWQWIDLDPPAGTEGEALEDWRFQAQMGLETFSPAPTFIIDSGRGMWGFWQREAFSNDPEEVEGINRALERTFGADNCHNIDRLARLPGTVNTKTGNRSAVFGWTPRDSAPLPAPIAGVVKGSAALDWSDCPDESEDDARIQIALNAKPSAKAAFEERATFKDLWFRNVDKLANTYPSHGEDPYDGSAADLALAQFLAFYCEKRPGWMQRLMRKSEMVREKWELREDYLERTIAKAIDYQKGVYEPQSKQESKPIERPESGIDEKADPNLYIGAYLDGAKQAELFKGFVYIRDTHRVLTPEGDMLDQGRFKACYGRRNFVLSATNGKDTTDAWKAFTESQVFRPPWAHGKGYRPDLPYGKIHKYGTKMLVNTYRDPKPEATDAPVDKFLIHLEKMLPVERDRRILLAYMAAIVQYKGRKFTWCPLIQGVQGNGKSMITEVLEYCVGEENAHRPSTKQLDSTFNNWMAHSMLAVVEDVNIPFHKMETIEALKPLISNERLPIEPKGVDAVTAVTCCNWILNTNRKNALLVDLNERRFAIFYTAQQSKADKEKAGMTGEYFADFWGWLRSRGGKAAILGYLMRYKICEEFNPAGECVEAPETSSSDEVVTETRSPAQAAVAEVIEQELPGTRGGFLSPTMVLRHLKEIHGNQYKIPQNGRVEFFQDLGYVPHPHLPNGGQVPRQVNPDGGRVRLYAVEGTEPGGGCPGTIATAYEVAQGFGADAEK